MLTKQQIFDKVAAHLLAQGARAYGVDGCVYRAADGKKCAVGCIIEDEHYSPDFEGVAIAWVNSTLDVGGSAKLRAALGASGVCVDEQHKLLLDLQRLHDNGDVDLWEAGLRVIASKHELEYNHA